MYVLVHGYAVSILVAEFQVPNKCFDNATKAMDPNTIALDHIRYEFERTRPKIVKSNNKSS